MQDNSRTIAIAATSAPCPLGFFTVLVHTHVHLGLYNQWWKDFECFYHTEIVKTFTTQICFLHILCMHCVAHS